MRPAVKWPYRFIDNQPISFTVQTYQRILASNLFVTIRIMLFFSAASKLALLGVLPLGLAVPAGSPGVPKDQGIQVTIEKDLGTSETELTVLDRADSQVLGSSCSDQLNLPALNISVTADINNTGSGHLTIGNKKYIIHQRPDFSGGITCSKIYNDGQVFVTCDVYVWRCTF